MAEQVRISTEEDVFFFRQKVRMLAKENGFGVVDQTALTTAVSELLRNMLLYAGKGEVSIDTLKEASRTGIKIIFKDKGPGIESIEKVMVKGYTSSGGLGMGLPGSKSLVDEFDIQSSLSIGTTITIVKWNENYMNA